MIKRGSSYDKQESRRKELAIPILVTRINDDPRGKTFFGYAKNISRGGMFIQSINPKNVKERFQIEFSLPGEKEAIGVMAEVVWKRQLASRKPYEPGMGMRFVDMEEGRSAEIDKWVMSRLEEELSRPGGVSIYG